VYTSTQQKCLSAGVAAYRQNQYAYASPQDLLLAVYDFGINACAVGDGNRAKAALVELVNSLNFDYHEVATGLLRVYNYCLELVGQGRFDEVEGILSELRATWAQAIANQTKNQSRKEAC
jgi:flagellar protein FliS